MVDGDTAQGSVGSGSDKAKVGLAEESYGSTHKAFDIETLIILETGHYNAYKNYARCIILGTHDDGIECIAEHMGNL